MHQQTQEVINAAAGLGAAESSLRAMFGDLVREVDIAISLIAREADEALMDETNPHLRGILDGAVCQRARAAKTAIDNARRDLAAALAAVQELARDVQRLTEAGPTA